MTSSPEAPAAFRAWALPPALEQELAPSVPEERPPSGDGDAPASGLHLLDLAPADARRVAEWLSTVRDDLLSVPVRELAGVLGRVGARFLDPKDPLRSEALRRLPGTAGCSPAMARRILDGMAADWTEARLWRLVEEDVPSPGALDGFVGGAGRSVRALGDRFALHLSAGTVPGVSVTSMIRSLLVKTPLLLKPGLGDVVLPVLFARGLREESSRVARAVAVVYWKGGGPEDAGRRGPPSPEDVLLAAAERVVVYGGDETVRSVRTRIAPTVPLVAYHHRTSVAVVGRAGVVGEGREASVRAVARAAVLFDQRGCVSPHAVFVEGGADDAIGFAEALSAALDEVSGELPAGPLDLAEAGQLRQRRDSAELVALAGGGEVRSGPGGTVLYEPEGSAAPGCGHRVLRVVPVDDLDDLPGRIAPLREHLQTVGVTGVERARLDALAEELARAGALRITSMHDVPFPPPWWHHDGRGPLKALVRWIDVEGDDPGRIDP